MSPGSSTESYPAFARVGLRENPGKNLNQVTCPDRDSNPGHLVSQPDALTVTPQEERQRFLGQGYSKSLTQEMWRQIYDPEGEFTFWKKDYEANEVRNLTPPLMKRFPLNPAKERDIRVLFPFLNEEARSWYEDVGLLEEAKEGSLAIVSKDGTSDSRDQKCVL
ncbi:hypothetical protein ANN_27143 [Periplaneta americana]|uniref:Per a allergen n=1 Tax=Periplaneta americana TaxID=6978 RepID=A0ABQ8RX97_PERAM|nr:hypothetical protein ANN_27143 [Periplaneta americana]